MFPALERYLERERWYTALIISHYVFAFFTSFIITHALEMKMKIMVYQAANNQN